MIDSTGLKVYREWKVRPYGYSKRRTWRKLHLAQAAPGASCTWRKLHLGLDERTGEVVACVLRDNDDAHVVPALLDQVEGEIAAVGGSLRQAEGLSRVDGPADCPDHCPSTRRSHLAAR